MTPFPTAVWVSALMEKLNTDQRYAHIARNWEGDMLFVIEPGGSLTQKMEIYLDLWHGKCRQAFIVLDNDERKPAFVMKAPYENFSRVIKGNLDPMQALMTRKLAVQGSMSVLMRNVPTVLDFVRCCREITDSVL
jgi:putative sterol carrier protein